MKGSDSTVKEPETIGPEMVLCVPTESLYAAIGTWRGLRKDASELWRPIARKSTFRPRSEVEDNPSYKQLISYTLFVSDKRIFVMKRLNAQGEERLHGRLSVGVGGHMNPVPEIPWPGRRRISDLKNILLANTFREIREEVALAGNPPVGILGILNDDQDDVGKVHLGVVSAVRLPSPLLAVKEKDKMLGAWVEMSKLHHLGKFESWSALLLNTLG